MDRRLEIFRTLSSIAGKTSIDSRSSEMYEEIVSFDTLPTTISEINSLLSPNSIAACITRALLGLLEVSKGNPLGFDILYDCLDPSTFETVLDSGKKSAKFRHFEQNFINNHVMNKGDVILSYFTVNEFSSQMYSLTVKISAFSGRDLYLQRRDDASGECDDKMRAFLQKASGLEVRSKGGDILVSNSRHYHVLLSRTGWRKPSGCMVALTRVNRTL